MKLFGNSAQKQVFKIHQMLLISFLFKFIFIIYYSILKFYSIIVIFYSYDYVEQLYVCKIVWFIE